MSTKKMLMSLFSRKGCTCCWKDKEINSYGFCRECFIRLCLLESKPGDDTFHVFRYEGEMRRIISDLKYRRKKYYAQRLAMVLAAYLAERKDTLSFDVIVPVPLHWKKEFSRGFNQSAMISVCLGRILKKKVMLDALAKSKNTISQTALGREDRKRNMSGIFASGRQRIMEKSFVLLVDDVYTTGATALSAKKTLLSAGASTVIILTVAKA